MIRVNDGLIGFDNPLPQERCRAGTVERHDIGMTNVKINCARKPDCFFQTRISVTAYPVQRSSMRI
jgi:hypothetical protein